MAVPVVPQPRKPLSPLCLPPVLAALLAVSAAFAQQPAVSPSRVRLVVGGDSNFPPFEYLDANGRPAGYNVDLTRAVARELGLQVEIRLAPWAQVRADLASGRLDAVQGIFYSPERDRTYDFTQPHAVISYVAVVQQGHGAPPETPAELRGRRLAVQRGDIMHDYTLANGLQERLTPLETQEAALEAVSRGEQECALVSRLTALYWVRHRQLRNLIVGRRPLLQADYCFAAPDNHRATIAQLSEGLKLVSESGEYRRIRERWMGVQEQNLNLPLMLRYAAAAATPLLIIVLAILLWSRSLRKQVAARTAELRRSERLLGAIIDGIAIPVFHKDRNGAYLSCNPAFARTVGLSQEEILGKTVFDLFPPELARRYWAADVELLEHGTVQVYESAFQDQENRLRQVVFHKAPLRAADGEIMGQVGAMIDLTDRKAAEEAVQRSERRFRLLVESSPQAIFVQSGGLFTYVNPAAVELLGFRHADELLGRPLPEAISTAVSENTAGSASGLPGPLTELTYLRPDGLPVLAETCAVPINYDGSDGVLVFMHNITERKRAEDTLRLFKTVFDTANFGAVITDLELRITYVNDYMAAVHGRRVEDLLGQHPRVFHSLDQEVQAQRMFERLLKEGRYSAEEIGHLRHDGATFPMLATAMLIREADGTPQAIATTAIDITELKALESQLQQVQKMEAVGQLAGGVAHDFNNMLSVILGHAQVALLRTDPSSPLYSSLTEIQLTAKRSAELTQQLLAFARRQTIRPRPLDLNLVVESALQMLRRLIGEEIDLVWLPGPELWPVSMDPSQLEQILTNLCVNARDAIRTIGAVTIETSNVTLDAAYCADHPGFAPGEFVVLAVSDDGSGMDRQTLDRIFEPFFTTKGVNRGTGLGLATVYGIVKQNDGFINVYSEPGHGTTFRVYLRRNTDPAAIEPAGEAIAGPLGQGETILLVEDEPAILEVGQIILEELGYEVLAARRPSEAVELVTRGRERIDLLMTDVVMPEMNGRELAAKLASLYPGLRTLFMSGYTANVIADRGVLEAGVHFIQKPFAMDEVARAVRKALGAL